MEVKRYRHKKAVAVESCNGIEKQLSIYTYCNTKKVWKNRFSAPSDKSDGWIFTKPEGFRVVKDVPASLMEHRGGLGLQSMACLFGI